MNMGIISTHRRDGMEVRTYVCRKGEEPVEIDLDKFNGVLSVEMSGGSIRVKGLEFKRKEDAGCSYLDS